MLSLRLNPQAVTATIPLSATTTYLDTVAQSVFFPFSYLLSHPIIRKILLPFNACKIKLSLCFLSSLTAKVILAENDAVQFLI